LDKELKTVDVADLNKEPASPFSPYGWGKEVEERKRAHQDWVQSLKPGDMVYYDAGRSYSHHRNITQVDKITATGMIRLKDGELVKADGYLRGHLSMRLLQPYTKEYEDYLKRVKVIRELNGMTFDHLTNEGLALVMHAINQASAMLPKTIEKE
jgi:hypothetical protein